MPSQRRLIHVIAISGAGQSYHLATLRPLAAGSARRDFLLAPQAASSTPPHRLGPPVAGAASRRSGGAVRLSAAVQVHRTASHERSPPPRLRSTSRRSQPRSYPVSALRRSFGIRIGFQEASIERQEIFPSAARTSFPSTGRKRENPKVAPFSSTPTTPACRVSRSSNRTGDRYRPWVAITGNPKLLRTFR